MKTSTILLLIMLVYPLGISALAEDMSLQEIAERRPFSIDLNTVELNDHIIVPISLRNSNSSSLDILGYNFSCSCLQVAPPTARLNKGEAGQFNVVIDLQKAAINKNHSFSFFINPVIQASNTSEKYFPANLSQRIS